MPSITALHHLSLTVTDMSRSVDWYREVFGFSVDADIERETFRRTRLRHPEAPIILTLTQHEEASSDRFNETRTGLDHLAFLAASFAEVDAWKQRFEQLGVAHSEVKREDGDVAMITLRDPDYIQVEVTAVRE